MMSGGEDGSLIRVSSTSGSLKRLKTPCSATGKHPLQVARRNERERKRVQQVNKGFITLRNHVPLGIKNKKLSKVETLRQAAAYIEYLQSILSGRVDVSPPQSTSIPTSLHDALPLTSTPFMPESAYASPDFLLNNCSPAEFGAHLPLYQSEQCSPNGSLDSGLGSGTFPDSTTSPNFPPTHLHRQPNHHYAL